MSRLERYAAYLLGGHWRALKIQVIRLRGHKCEACSCVNFLQGHHLIYRDPLESCTEEDIMLLCPKCHEMVHRDKALDEFLKSQSATPSPTRRKIVMRAIEWGWGGASRLEKHRRSMERSRAGERKELDARPPLRECRRPRKRWLDYTPELIQPKRPWLVP